MAYDETLNSRISNITSKWRNTDSKKMFGGVCHLLNGNMVCGVNKDSLILRLGEKGAEDAMELPGVRPFDMTGRPMKGWVMVDPEGIPTDGALLAWLEKAKGFVDTLPLK